MDSPHHDYITSPAKRRKPNPPREIGVMRKSFVDNGSATFLGSSSGIHFIRTVYNSFARRSAHLSQSQNTQENLVPGEDDQLLQSPGYDAQAVKNELWAPQELDHRSRTASFEQLVQWTRSYFECWHPMFPFLSGPKFLELLEQISQGGLDGVKTTDVILIRSIVSISLMDGRQVNATRSTPVPAKLVFRTVDQAMESLHTLFCDPPTISILQAAFSVELFLASLLRLNAASRIGGVITRTAFHLGLHRCPARFACFSPEEAAIRQRLFWSIYCLERYLSQSLGIPLSIRDDDIDVCYPGIERHGEGIYDPNLRLLTYLAKFARVRGLVLELRNKSILHSQETSNTATQVNGELAHWWNEVYDDVYPVEEDPGLSPLHRLLLIVFRHESIISMNRPLLAAEQSSPEYKAALQVCIESSRSLITALRGYVLPGGQGTVPLVWPSFTWAVWMSCLILVYAAWEGDFPVLSASRYAKTGLSILQNLSLRGNTWSQTCIEAIRDLESALSNPPPTPPIDNRTASPGPAEDRAPDYPTNIAEDPRPAPQYHPSVVFGDSSINNFPLTYPFPDPGDFESGWNDLWTVADGPWLIEENFDQNFGFQI
ncbi:specific transcription factor domain protein [Aspergillus parasiticus SU-1]|uniref:Specific transcription factor domain protein n=1 Tax=Aspergillus parasiticus (strain ATCC 56775 / NRRL 5862 / SRRC 143 / SU-1) TaxID=1403190 RepID=A0A0F0IM33_ASPPU|nr:specific transcription factor domain protein [Aspergillus parasiticus SU-1]